MTLMKTVKMMLRWTRYAWWRQGTKKMDVTTPSYQHNKRVALLSSEGSSTCTERWLSRFAQPLFSTGKVGHFTSFIKFKNFIVDPITDVPLLPLPCPTSSQPYAFSPWLDPHLTVVKNRAFETHKCACKSRNADQIIWKVPVLDNKFAIYNCLKVCGSKGLHCIKGKGVVEVKWKRQLFT